MPNVEHLPVRAQGQRGRPTRHRHLALWRQVTGLGIHRKNPYLVIVLEGNIHVVWHGSTSSACAQASCCLSHRTPLTAGAVQPALQLLPTACLSLAVPIERRHSRYAHRPYNRLGLPSRNLAAVARSIFPSSLSFRRATSLSQGGAPLTSTPTVGRNPSALGLPT